MVGVMLRMMMLMLMTTMMIMAMMMAMEMLRKTGGGRPFEWMLQCSG